MSVKESIRNVGNNIERFCAEHGSTVIVVGAFVTFGALRLTSRRYFKMKNKIDLEVANYELQMLHKIMYRFVEQPIDVNIVTKITEF